MSTKRRQQFDSQFDDKRHKKGHKHHKRHKKQDNDNEDQLNVEDIGEKMTPLKLTIKIGGQTLGEKSVIKSSIRSLNSVSNQTIDDDSNDDNLDLSVSFNEDDDNLRIDEELQLNDTEELDEEEVWLDALEEGRLHEVDDELRKIRDPKLMTARQRALLENKSLKEKSETIKAIGSQIQDSNKIMSKEMAERKMIKDRRRRQQAEEKKEKDKKQTIDRLLRKRQELAKAKKKKKLETPQITYKNTTNGIFICLPIGLQFEFKASKINPDLSRGLSRVKCVRNGCNNDKKYLCSKTKLPVCSLYCYKHINK